MVDQTKEKMKPINQKLHRKNQQFLVENCYLWHFYTCELVTAKFKFLGFFAEISEFNLKFPRVYILELIFSVKCLFLEKIVFPQFLEISKY